MNEPKNTGVVYLLKDRFQMYSTSLPDIQECHLSSHAVHNLNLVSKKLLRETVDGFISKHNISACNLIIVIGDSASFITDLEQDDLDTAEKKFHEQVPENQLIVRTIDTLYKKLLYGTNKEIYSVIKEAFEDRGCTVDYVMPGVVFENAQPVLTLSMAAMIFGQTLQHKKDNLLTNPFVIARQEEEASEKFFREQRKHDILRLYAYSTLFGVFIIALLVVWNVNNATPSQTYRGQAEDNQTVMPGAQETKNLTVEIKHSPTSAETADKIQKLFAKYNFKKVTVRTQATTPQTKNLIIFSGSTSPTVRSAILTEVKKHIINIAVQDDPTAPTDITIILR